MVLFHMGLNSVKFKSLSCRGIQIVTGQVQWMI